MDLQRYREDLVRQEAFARHALIEQAERVEYIASTLAKRLRRGPSCVSSLGELQAAGPTMDAFCGAYEHARQTLKRFDIVSGRERTHGQGS